MILLLPLKLATEQLRNRICLFQVVCHYPLRRLSQMHLARRENVNLFLGKFSLLLGQRLYKTSLQLFIHVVLLARD